MIRALLWDVDGTLAETEQHGHLRAFNAAFAAAGVPWRWSDSRYAELLAVAGGRERLLHDLRTQPAAPAAAAARQALAQQLHRLKNEHYEAIVRRGELPLRHGVADLIADCSAAGVALGIVTTTSAASAAALLACHLGAQWRSRFQVVVCAEQAPRKKPDPQAYLLALEALKIRADEAVAIEDSPAGRDAARRAGLPVVVTHSHYFPAAGGAGVLASGPSLGAVEGWRPPAQPDVTRVSLQQIERWYAAGLSRADHDERPKVP
jgi:HAD superfamily hydrolase (TIGR01509 family)